MKRSLREILFMIFKLIPFELSLDFFFSHISMAQLSQHFNIVFVLDCTYKTNRFGKPFLNIVGITSTYITFNAGFALMREENEVEYTWALKLFSRIVSPDVIVTDRELALMNTINTVYPKSQNLLCIWHVNKNILAQIKKQGCCRERCDNIMKEWNEIGQSKTCDMFNNKWLEFEEKRTSSSSEIVAYIERTWIVHKEKIARCWTDKFCHFGTTSTSRGESNHHVLKRYLKTPNSDLLQLYQKLCVVLERQFTELNYKIQFERRMTYHHHKKLPLVEKLIGKIAKHALDQKIHQHKLVKIMEKGDVCTGRFRSSMGIPCKHEIQMKIDRGGVFEVADFHTQWHLDHNPLTPTEVNENNGMPFPNCAPDIDRLTPRKREL
jgi:hypothetical protein